MRKIEETKRKAFSIFRNKQNNEERIKERSRNDA
jgi:hypothetical protein